METVVITQEARMYPLIEQELQRQETIDRQRAAADSRRARYSALRAGDQLAAAVAHDVAIRDAEASDVRALIRLSDLDSQTVPAGRVLVAEVDGKVRAALAVETGRIIADPFEETLHVRALLRLRAEQLHIGPSRRHGLLGLLTMRPGRAA
jgi:hypothetical protein